MALGVAAISVTLLTGCSSGQSATPEDPVAGVSGGVAVPSSSVNDAMIACMGDAGWQGQMQLDGTISFGIVPDSQQSSFSSDQASCSTKTGWGDLQGISIG